MKYEDWKKLNDQQQQEEMKRMAFESLNALHRFLTGEIVLYTTDEVGNHTGTIGVEVDDVRQR